MELSSAFAKTQLKNGTSEAVTDLYVDDIRIGWTQEVVIRLMFKPNTPLEQIVSDRDKVRENYYTTLQRLAAEADVPDLFFILDEEPAPQRLEYDKASSQPDDLPF